LDQANSKHPVLPRHNWPRHHRINHTTKQRQSSASEAIQGIKHITPDQPLKKQLDDICTKTRQAITTTDAPHNKKGNNIARKKQQQLINKAPKKAHKEILKDKNAQPRAKISELRFNTQCVASTCTTRSMSRDQSKPTPEGSCPASFRKSCTSD
jgi:hypothetical protein